MRALHENNWMPRTDIKGEEKGRPRRVYSRSVSLDEIIKHYEEEKSHESAQAMEAIRRLKEDGGNLRRNIGLFQKFGAQPTGFMMATRP